MRAVDEWVGKTDDAMPPPRVRLRIFERYNGICYLSGIKISPGMKWQPDHIIAIINGGKNCESNMAPALTEPHRVKTNADLKIKSKIARVRKKFTGASQTIGQRKAFQSKFKKKVNGEVVLR